MATDPSELYDIRETQTIWHAPINVIVVDDEAAVVDNLSARLRRALRVAAVYRKQYAKLDNEYCNVANDLLAFNEKTGDMIRAQQRQIFHLEAEIRGLEHTNALHLEIIDAQAARIKSLEAQLASLAPAMKISATDNLG